MVTIRADTRTTQFVVQQFQTYRILVYFHVCLVSRMAKTLQEDFSRFFFFLLVRQRPLGSGRSKAEVLRQYARIDIFEASHVKTRRV